MPVVALLEFFRFYTGNFQELFNSPIEKLFHPNLAWQKRTETE